MANILDAESMAVWKDVDGVLNADPKIFPDAVQIAELNYLDTIELAYSGAQIIHPQDDQTAAEQEYSALRAAFRRQAQTGYRDSRHVRRRWRCRS